jgi:hypothetical protein
MTGKATYHYGIGRGSWSEPVTRTDTPAKFREATNILWGWSAPALLTSAVAFIFSRKLDESEEEL